jgi:hypothetical protein
VSTLEPPARTVMDEVRYALRRAQSTRRVLGRNRSSTSDSALDSRSAVSCLSPCNFKPGPDVMRQALAKHPCPRAQSCAATAWALAFLIASRNGRTVGGADTLPSNVARVVTSRP